MPQFKVKERRVTAHQWFHGNKCPGVSGDDPKMLCGCVMLGNDASRPHVHTGPLSGEYITPGVWVFRYEGDRFYSVMTPEEFSEAFDKI